MHGSMRRKWVSSAPKASPNRGTSGVTFSTAILPFYPFRLSSCTCGEAAACLATDANERSNPLPPLVSCSCWFGARGNRTCLMLCRRPLHGWIVVNEGTFLRPTHKPNPKPAARQHLTVPAVPHACNNVLPPNHCQRASNGEQRAKLII